MVQWVIYLHVCLIYLCLHCILPYTAMYMFALLSFHTLVHIILPSDIQALHQGSRNHPFHALSISPIEPPTHILISGLPPGTPEFALKLYLEKLGAEAEHVELLPSNQAIVKLTTCGGKYMYMYTVNGNIYWPNYFNG